MIASELTVKNLDSHEKADLEKFQLVSLNPWTEYVGRVVDITETGITIEAVQCFSIPISPDALKESKTLRKGNRVGILVLEDGTIRIRSASS